MTVRELCEYLKQFDPEREIWVTYDNIAAFEPEFKPADDRQVMMYHSDGVHPGDLIMEVG